MVLRNFPDGGRERERRATRERQKDAELLIFSFNSCVALPFCVVLRNLPGGWERERREAREGQKDAEENIGNCLWVNQNIFLWL